ETFLAFAADHGCEMEDRRGGIGADGGEDGVAIADVAGDLSHARIDRGVMEERVEQHDLADWFRSAGWASELAAFEEFLTKLGAEEAASSCDDDFHAWIKGT